MARTLRKAELWSHVTQVGVLRTVSGGGSTTVATAPVAGAVTVALADGVTSFTNGDPLLLGTAEQMEVNQIEAAPNNTEPLKYPIFRAHAIGEPVVEAVKIVLGDIDDSGVTAGVSGGDFNAVKSATKRLVQAYLIGHLEEVIEFKVENYNLENLASAMGVSDVPNATTGPITGAGVVADPYRLVLDGTNITSGPAIVQAFYFTGALKGGGLVEIQAWGAEVDPTALTAQHQRGQPAYIPFRVRPCAGLSFETY
jgi:hypothetical protein